MSCIYSEWLHKVARQIDNNAYAAVCYEAARCLDEVVCENEQLKQKLKDLDEQLKFHKDSDQKAQVIIQKVMNASMAPGSVACRLINEKAKRILAEVNDLVDCLNQ